jgi:hypothetical protein
MMHARDYTLFAKENMVELSLMRAYEASRCFISFRTAITL